ncbi:MAG: hypothetical protein Q9220_006717 [cf. Caloplaca sp. 1 TL-2023]
MKHSLTLLTLILTTHLQPILSIVISFGNGPSTARILQVCKDDTAPSICCVPLDLNLMDGRSYGWFRADQVAFAEIAYDDTFAAVYDTSSHNPCSGEILYHHMGASSWVSPKFPFHYAGSALAISSSGGGPRFAPKKRPGAVLIGEVWYLHEKTIAETSWFRNEAGRYVFGRPFDIEASRKATNGTSSAADAALVDTA